MLTDTNNPELALNLNLNTNTVVEMMHDPSPIRYPSLNLTLDREQAEI